MENKEIIKQLVKLHILTVRWIERHTNLKCITHRDTERIITSNKLTCTYEEAVKNLKTNVLKYCSKSVYLINETLQLECNINDSNLNLSSLK